MAPCGTWTSVLSALATPVLALFAGYIAWRQWHTARNRLKFDLFERRLAIYEAARRFLATIAVNGGVSDVDPVTFLRETRSARWLFSDEIDRYLTDAIYKPACELRSLERTLTEHLDQVARASNIAEQRRLKDLLDEVSKSGLDLRIGEYLRLTDS